MSSSPSPRSTIPTTLSAVKQPLDAQSVLQESPRQKHEHLLSLVADATSCEIETNSKKTDLSHLPSRRGVAAMAHTALPSSLPSEQAILKANHRFLWPELTSTNHPGSSKTHDTQWKERVARKYYNALFKEYCLANLSRYREGQIALRWRSSHEVRAGKGQFVCGDLSCAQEHSLHSWEVNFRYKEQGDVKNALVKLRLCPECSYRLHYRKVVDAGLKKRPWHSINLVDLLAGRMTSCASSAKEHHGKQVGEVDMETQSKRPKIGSEEPVKSSLAWQINPHPLQASPSKGSITSEKTTLKMVEEEMDDFFADLLQ